jgi:histidinol-phosphate aminotransferase
MTTPLRVAGNPAPTRRSFLAGAAAAAVALPSAGLAQPLLEAKSNNGMAEFHPDAPPYSPPEGVYIGSNENPLGPSAAARAALSDNVPRGGRYDRGGEKKLAKLFADQNGLTAESVAIYPGSFVPLHYAGRAFSSPERSIVSPVPTFDSMFYGSDRKSLAAFHAIPLTSDYTIDIKAMVAADPNAGILYICNPNNPTGTCLTRDHIGWVLKNKPKGAIVVVDEAYIHYTDAETALPFVAAGEDIVVSRTFSKIYGLAGLRCGLVAARPDLLAKLRPYETNPMPTPALTAATASLLEPNLVEQRKQYTASVRQGVYKWLEANKYEYVPSTANFFMVKVGRPGAEISAAMAQNHVFISGPRPRMPDWVRVSIGTREEMDRFQVAFKDALSKPSTGAPVKAPRDIGMVEPTSFFDGDMSC